MAIEGSGKSDRAVAGVFCFVLGLAFATSLYASLSARGLFGDGVYYLYRIAVGQWFHSVDPPRTTVNLLRQAPIVLLTRYSGLSMFERGQAFTFIMLVLPAAFCAICWRIAPPDRKGWVIFPLLDLTATSSATSFFANSEASTATSCWWCLMFMVMFRTRKPLSQLLFLALCVPAFQLQEGIFPLMLVLLLACVVRLMEAVAWRDRFFLSLSSLLIVSIIFYELRWVIDPRIPANRAGILHSLAYAEYLVLGGRLNLPLVTGLVALLALGGVILTQWRLRGSRASLRSRQIAVCFCAFSVAAAAASVLVDASFAPGAQLAARYQPVMISFGLGLIMLGFEHWNVPERIWLRPATFTIIAALGVAQATADIAATWRWQAYVADLDSRLQSSRGLIRWEDTLNTGDAAKDTNWRLMSIEWVIPLMSIAMARNGVVTTMINTRPDIAFRPMDASRPDQFPVIRGVDFSPYRAAIGNR
jgi:hypothetical protein